MHERLENVDPYFAELRVQLEDAKERVKKLENDIQSYYIANKIKRQFKRRSEPIRRPPVSYFM
jgi:hypothetical protein